MIKGGYGATAISIAQHVPLSRHVTETRPCCLLKPAHKVQLDFVRPAAAVAGELGGEAGIETAVEQSQFILCSALSVCIGAVYGWWFPTSYHPQINGLNPETLQSMG